MAIVGRHYLNDLECKYKPLWWHKQNLSYTANGYGRKIPSPYMVKLPSDNQWRRVYTCCFSNSGTSYVLVKGDWVVIQ